VSPNPINWTASTTAIQVTVTHPANVGSISWGDKSPVNFNPTPQSGAGTVAVFTGTRGTGTIAGNYPATITVGGSIVANATIAFSTGVTPPPTTNPTPPQTGLGGTEPAIADWDIVPFQTVSGTWRPGVVAWHVNAAGIARVDFSVDQKPAGTVTAMALNPDTNVTEFFPSIDTSALAAGSHQISAVVTPVVGKARTLPSYQFSAGVAAHSITATGGNTASACQSAKTQFGFGDGVTILLGSGTWTVDWNGLDTKATYLTFAAAPGANVTVNGFSGASPHHIHFKDINKMTGGVPNISAADPRFLWIDHCTLDHGDPFTDTSLTGWTDARSGGTPGQPWTSGDGMVQTACVTDSTITNSANGWLNGLLLRNCTITKLGSDAISNNQTSINCTISSLGISGSGMHPDVGQWNNHKTGVIIYGLTATSLDLAQGISPEDNGARDWAIANVSLQSKGDGNMLGLGTTLTNFLVKNAVLNAPSQVRAASGWTGTDVVFEHVVDGGGNPVGGVPAGVTVR
jgi:hypothetical protein